jgi:uncharacterized coiled-coil protein SlyX
MATMEDRVTALETRVSAIEATLVQMTERLGDVQRTVHERFADLRAWLMALTGLMGAQFAAIVGLAILVAWR